MAMLKKALTVPGSQILVKTLKTNTAGLGSGVGFKNTKPTFENARLAADEIERLRDAFKRLASESDYPTMTRSDMVNFAKKMLE